MNTLRKYEPNDAYERLLRSFKDLSESPDANSYLKSYAKRCHNYAQTPNFKDEYINCFSAHKISLEDVQAEREIYQLAEKGKQKAINIISNSMDTVYDQVDQIVKGEYMCKMVIDQPYSIS